MKQKCIKSNQSANSNKSIIARGAAAVKGEYTVHSLWDMRYVGDNTLKPLKPVSQLVVIQSFLSDGNMAASVTLTAEFSFSGFLCCVYTRCGRTGDTTPAAT